MNDAIHSIHSKEGRILTNSDHVAKKRHFPTTLFLIHVKQHKKPYLYGYPQVFMLFRWIGAWKRKNNLNVGWHRNCFENVANTCIAIWWMNTIGLSMLCRSRRNFLLYFDVNKNNWNEQVWEMKSSTTTTTTRKPLTKHIIEVVA